MAKDGADGYGLRYKLVIRFTKYYKTLSSGTARI